MRSWQRAGLVVVCGSALTALVGGSAFGLDRKLARWLGEGADSDAQAHEIVPEPTARTRVRSPSPRPAAVAGRAPTEVAHSAQPPPAAPVVAVPSGIVVPDLDGMRVSRARRELRALGLRLVVRDEYDEPIEPSDSYYYRVRGRTMRPVAGTVVERGSRVRFLGRPIEELGEGY